MHRQLLTPLTRTRTLTRGPRGLPVPLNVDSQPHPKSRLGIERNQILLSTSRTLTACNAEPKEASPGSWKTRLSGGRIQQPGSGCSRAAARARCAQRPLRARSSRTLAGCIPFGEQHVDMFMSICGTLPNTTNCHLVLILGLISSVRFGISEQVNQTGSGHRGGESALRLQQLRREETSYTFLWKPHLDFLLATSCLEVMYTWKALHTC